MGTYITKEHKKELETEVETLRSTLSGKVADKLAESTTKDQVEDATYAEAMQERDMLQGRIEEIETILENAEIIDSKVCNNKYVTLGAWITIDMGAGEKEIRLVGASESNPSEGKISYESPLGEALIGAKKGESVFIVRPDGTDQEIKVKDIRCK
jgi:transcription elongation factor GreA